MDLQQIFLMAFCSETFPYFMIHMCMERDEKDQKLWKILAPWLVNGTPLGYGGGFLKTEM